MSELSRCSRLCQAELAAAGYAQYETSAYARAGERCVHNLNYWNFGDYLGVGAGAHGKLSDATTWPDCRAPCASANHGATWRAAGTGRRPRRACPMPTCRSNS